MSTENRKSKKNLLIVMVGIGLATVAAAAMLANISERKAEEKSQFVKVVELDDSVTDPAVWRQNFPLQYESFMKTSEMKTTLHAGSALGETLPATERYPKGHTWARSKGAVDPRYFKIKAGDDSLLEPRGHFYARDEARASIEYWQSAKPGRCLSCHSSSIVQIMNELGDGDADLGYEKMSQLGLQETLHYFDKDHGISCNNCHDPKTMQLRIINKHFIRGIRDLKAARGIKDYDVNRDATHNEMRSFVCAQCHVEYYVKESGGVPRLGWSKGITADDLFTFYSENNIISGNHTITGTPLYSVADPLFETWTQSIHAQNGVGCADCHMPYERHGAQKFTSHHIRSPLFAINKSCLNCHRATEEEMRARVENIQDQFTHVSNQASDMMVRLIDLMEKAKNDPDFPKERMEAAQKQHAIADFYWQYGFTEASHGFHAPAYMQKVMADSMAASARSIEILRGADPAEVEPSEFTQKHALEARQRKEQQITKPL